MHGGKIVAVNIQRRAERVHHLGRQKRPAIRFDALQLAEFFAYPAMPQPALGHGGIQRINDVGRCVQQPSGHVALNQFQRFKIAECALARFQRGITVGACHRRMSRWVTKMSRPT